MVQDVEGPLTARSQIAEGESQSIGSTLWDTLWIQLLLTFLRFDDLLLGQITHSQISVQLLQILSGNDIRRVDDVSERL